MWHRSLQRLLRREVAIIVSDNVDATVVTIVEHAYHPNGICTAETAIRHIATVFTQDVGVRRLHGSASKPSTLFLVVLPIRSRKKADKMLRHLRHVLYLRGKPTNKVSVDLVTPIVRHAVKEALQIVHIVHPK